MDSHKNLRRARMYQIGAEYRDANIDLFNMQVEILEKGEYSEEDLFIAETGWYDRDAELKDGSDT